MILPQAVRRVGPPLLNDFIALQKDVALVSILGVAARRSAIAQIDAAVDLQLHAADRRGAALPVRHDPAGAAARPLGARPGGSARDERAGPRDPRRDQVLRRRARSCAASTSQVAEHEAVALIGASGSGKSTLLRCIDLLEDIDDGDVLLDGEVITDPSVDTVGVRRRLGLVFQAYNLFPHLTALENVVLGHRRARTGHREAEAERARPRRCSSASASRAARTTAPTSSRAASSSASRSRARSPARPRAMLLDEVTSALDPELVGEVLEAVRELKAEGVTMLIATHEMSFAREVADTVGFLHDGRILELGPPAGPLRAPRARDAALPAPAAGGPPA